MVFEKYTAPRCSICNHPQRDEIENAILDGLETQTRIAERYGVYDSALSVHKNKHMFFNVREKLKAAVQKAILQGVQPENTTELIRLMEYVEKMDADDYLDVSRRWQKNKLKLYKRFVTLLDRLVGLPDEYLDNVKRAAYIAFIQEPRDIGEICRTWMEDELPEEYKKVEPED